MSNSVHNVNVASQYVLTPPAALREALPLTDALRDAVTSSRETVWNILERRDHRLLVVVGPCSIHDPEAAWITRGACAPLPARWMTPSMSSCVRTSRSRARPWAGKA
jgi:phospho-2-dehydro-3-deoxyheptonate aldolase